MNKILIFTFMAFLLAFSVNAGKDVGESCLNNNECTSNVCQGGECREADLTTLLDAIPGGDGAEDTTPPTILDTMPITIYTTTATLSLTTDEDATCKYSTTPGISYNSMTYSLTSVDSLLHTASLTSLTNNIYNYYIRCKDSSGNKNNNDYLTTFTVSTTGTATCSDRLLNQGETGIDCGGPCSVCATCYDEIQNQDETEVDCGGPCIPCSIEKASKSPTFWIIFITSFLVIVVLLLGFWYFKLKKGAEGVGEQVKQITKRPPTQPSSLLRI